VYINTHGTHLVSSREPRGDSAENPAEHPEQTWRLSVLQGPSVRHWPLLRQPCPASKNTGEAIGTQRLAICLHPDLRGRTYVRTYSGASQGSRQYLRTPYGRKHVYRRLVLCRGRFQYNNVLCSRVRSQ
jgi:hypothetical protein